ncbi:hypothetical protein GCM10025886_11420 [Tetragenococcus halophilus subsp. flandriensis]|uniref:hypothetical protein n=1 Tax=Tetragenococcus halophilus TaxID=51669 RepID=UPI0023E93047|nr:hypothetical protein [Tetragenococcus halophilus]GMA07991.1 hypothetical protein GCM10025886_11420 [Tetragenococcus halophilus subsp. flandriensis]
MKKKQLAKLQQQFQPSFKSIQSNLFLKMQEKVSAKYGFKVKAFTQTDRPDVLVVRRLDLDDDARNKEINLSLDENFTNMIKRIQNGEKGLGELFSDNLAQEVASHWTSVNDTTPQNDSVVTENDVEAKDQMTLSSFKDEIANYPNFYVETIDDRYEVKEQTKTESRLLATISRQSENEYTIETALKRKYKLKLALIPIIETFASTPLSNR